MIFLDWLNDLISSLNKNEVIKNNGCKCKVCSFPDKTLMEASVQITDKMSENALIIDSTSYVKYFTAILEPGYPYDKSLKDAENCCVGYVKKWLNLD